MIPATRRAFLGSMFAPAMQRRRPNILLILADDLGYECLSCYGGTSYRTPNLDRLAAEGVRFTHAYSQPLCTPTRLQMMTGLYNFRNWRAFGVMDPKERTFGHWFTEAGYRTAIAGKWQFWSYNPPDFEPEWRGKGQLPKDAGFQEWCLWHPAHTEDKGSRYGDPTYEVNGELRKERRGEYGEDVYADFLLSFIEKHRAEPWFAYYPMALTHGPFTATPKSAGWDTARLQNDPANFKDMVEYMDATVGRVLARVDALGLRDDTLVMFYSDNGTAQGLESTLGAKTVKGGKGLPTDAGTRVPLLARFAGVTPKGRVLDDLVDSTDFLPTMFEAARLPLPAGVKPDGRSFLPQLRGERGRPRDWVFCHHDPRPGHDKKQFTLVRFARDRRYKLYEDGRLFDVAADELERTPLNANDAAAARRKLRAVLDRLKP